MADEQEGTLTPQGPTFELVSVTEEQRRATWLTERQKGVGASEVSALFDLSPFGQTIQTLFDEKVGALKPDEDSPDKQRGRYLEPIILTLFAKATGRVIVPAHDLPNYGLFVHPDDPHMLATPDGEQDLPGRPTVEAKSPRQKKFGYIQNRGLSDAWIMQLQHQLEVCNRDYGTFVFHGADSWTLCYFDVERDRELGEALRDKVRLFWLMVERGERPTGPMAYDDLPRITTPPGKLTIRTDPEWAEAVGLLSEAKALMRDAEQIEEAAKLKIKELMGGHGSVQGAGVRVHFKQREGKVTFDHDALVGARPLDPILVAKAVYETVPNDKDLQLALIEALSKTTMDVSRFNKRGMPFDDLRSYVLKDDAEDTESLPRPRLRLTS